MIKNERSRRANHLGCLTGTNIYKESICGQVGQKDSLTVREFMNKVDDFVNTKENLLALMNPQGAAGKAKRK